MPEELKPTEREQMPDSMVSNGSIEQGGDALPLSDMEQQPETAQERAAERYAEMLAQAQGASKTPIATDEDAIVIDAKSVFSETDAETRVSKLVSLAELKGPVYAVRVAQKLNDLYVLDRMHDELVEKFHTALQSKGMI